jgi:hypothetical protein
VTPSAAAGTGGKLAAQSGKAGAGGAGAAAPSSKPDAGTGAAGTGAASVHGQGSSSERAGKLYATMDISNIPSGDEAHRCVLVELPNTDTVWVSTLHASLSGGSHHLIVDRRTAKDELLTTAETCSPTMGGDASRLMIAQQPDTVLQLPAAVGFKLDAKQRIFLQLHYINATAKSLTIKGELELSMLPSEQAPIEAKSSFTGATSISLPAHQPGVSTFFQTIPAMPVRNVFALTSHTHSLGVRSTIERVASMDAAETTPLHESRDWSEPPLTVFDKPLVFDGKDGLRLTCHYMNTTDRDVHFGTAVADEMCFMWLYYYES